MKALVYTGPKMMEIRDVAKPEPDVGEVLVRVAAVGICGSDMHGYLGHDSRRPAPLILGHEAAGIIEGGPRDGERVTINPLVPCGLCEACETGRENICENRQLISMPPREGAFADYVVMPEANVVTVPDDVPMSKAALIEPLAVSWHAVQLAFQMAHERTTKSTLVLGGGAIGLAAALCLRAMDVEDITIVEPNAERARVLEAMGERVVPEPSGRYSVVFDAVGYDVTRRAAAASIKPGGLIFHIGLGGGNEGLDIRHMTLQEVGFIGTYCYTPQEFRDTAQAVFKGWLGSLDWPEQRALSDGAAAFDDILAGRVAAPKIILTP